MKIFKIIGKAIKSIAKFFGKAGKETGEVITGAYEGLDDIGKLVVPIAVNVVQALKTIVESPVTDIVTAIIEAAIPGEKDDIIIEKVKCWLRKELPKLALKLQIANSIIHFKTPDDKVKYIIGKFQIKREGSATLEFATSLAGYLADGDFSSEERKKAIEDYYNRFVKN